MTPEEWIEQQLDQAPTLSPAAARRVSAALFPAGAERASGGDHRC